MEVNIEEQRTWDNLHQPIEKSCDNCKFAERIIRYGTMYCHRLGDCLSIEKTDELVRKFWVWDKAHEQNE